MRANIGHTHFTAVNIMCAYVPGTYVAGEDDKGGLDDCLQAKYCYTQRQANDADGDFSIKNEFV